MGGIEEVLGVNNTTFRLVEILLKEGIKPREKEDEINKLFKRKEAELEKLREREKERKEERRQDHLEESRTKD